MSMTYLSGRVQIARKQLNLTATELGERVSVSQGHISKIEAGDRNPTPALARSLANALGVREEWLLEGTEPMYGSNEIGINYDTLVVNIVEEELDCLRCSVDTDEYQKLIEFVGGKLKQIRKELNELLKRDYCPVPSPLLPTKNSQNIKGQNVIAGNFNTGDGHYIGGDNIAGDKYINTRVTKRVINTPPEGSISESQAREIHERLVRLGGMESTRIGPTAYGAVMNQFKKKFEVASYKNLLAVFYEDAISYLDRREKIIEKNIMNEGRHPVSRQEYIRRIQTICRVELKWTDPIRKQKMSDRYGKSSLPDFNMSELEDFYKYVGSLKSGQQRKDKK